MDRYLAGKPEWGKTRTVLQSDPQGLGQAICLALPYTSDDEPLLIILGDTLFDADLGRLAGESENVLYTYKVLDPRRFGVAVTGKNGRSPARAGGRALAALLTLFALAQNFPMATLVGADTLNNIISFERIQLPFNALYGHF